MQFTRMISLTVDVKRRGDLKILQIFRNQKEVKVIVSYDCEDQDNDFIKTFFEVASVQKEIKYNSKDLVVLAINFYLIADLEVVSMRRHPFIPVEGYHQVPLSEGDHKIYQASLIKQSFLNVLEKKPSDTNYKDFIIKSLMQFPGQVRNARDFSYVMSYFFNASEEEVYHSEQSELLMFQFIMRLSAILKNDTKDFQEVEGQAHLDFFKDGSSIGLNYRSLDATVLLKMARILNSFFEKIAHVEQVYDRGDYWLLLNRDVFFQKVFPAFVNSQIPVEKLPEIKIHSPTLIPWKNEFREEKFNCRLM